ncbi:MAG: 50S ribosomal protein L22 [Candidatus Cloacimonetes bacterium]|nr:50S ribosomal protein L22 [Candidatus Cloacimonadota bacterium]
MEAIAKVKSLRGSARKARLVLDQIRGRNVIEAQNILTFSKKRAAKAIAKLLNSAIANATSKEGKADIEHMTVFKAFADDAQIDRRWRMRAHGRATIVRKRNCHITIGVSDAHAEGGTLGSES